MFDEEKLLIDASVKEVHGKAKRMIIYDKHAIQPLEKQLQETLMDMMSNTTVKVSDDGARIPAVLDVGHIKRTLRSIRVSTRIIMDLQKKAKEQLERAERALQTCKDIKCVLYDKLRSAGISTTEVEPTMGVEFIHEISEHKTRKVPKFYDKRYKHVDDE